VAGGVHHFFCKIISNQHISVGHKVTNLGHEVGRDMPVIRPSSAVSRMC
jgi:hypothetical protein